MVAVAVPDIGPLVSLVGSVGFSLLGLVVPVAMETVWYWSDEDDDCDGGTATTAARCEPPARGNLCRRIMRHVKNLVLLVFASLALVGGAFYNIRDIVARASGDLTAPPVWRRIDFRADDLILYFIFIFFFGLFLCINKRDNVK